MDVLQKTKSLSCSRIEPRSFARLARNIVTMPMTLCRLPNSYVSTICKRKAKNTHLENDKYKYEYSGCGSYSLATLITWHASQSSYSCPHGIYKVSQEERSIFWEVTVSVILSKNVYMNMCPTPNGFRGRGI